MAVRVPPSWLQARTDHTAEGDRLALGALLGSPATAFSGGVSAVDPGHGVTGSGDLAVTQNGTPNMSVNVAAGNCLIRGTQSTFQGIYSATNDGTVNLSIATSDSTNPRRDLIIMQVRDSAYSGASDDARLVVVTGTPAASPSDPSLSSFPNALVLARVAVAAGATSVVTANITDLRTKAASWANGRGEEGRYATITADTGGISTSFVDINTATISWTAIPGRVYVTRALIPRITQNTSAGEPVIIITDGSNAQKGLRWNQYLNGANYTASPYLEAREAGLSGAQTRKLRALTSGGTLTVNGASFGGFLQVLDVGAA